MQKLRRPRVLLSAVALGSLVYATVHVLPSRHIRIAAGPVGGSFYETAVEYRKIIEQKGYRVEIVPFQNTDEIGADVADDRRGLDIGFVAEDLGAKASDKLMSLGDIQLQPIFIFENSRTAATRPIHAFSDLRGMTLVLPPERSLTSRTLLGIFALNDIDRQNTHIEFLPLDQGIDRLKHGAFDVGLFILAADSDLMADLARDPNLTIVQIAQQTAITKKLTYLKEVSLPAGIFDLAHDLPAHDVGMLAATISVAARRDLPPATTYAVLEAMREVHRRSSYVNRSDEFPRYSGNVDLAESRVDDFYRNGTPWTYAHFPAALASVVDGYLAPLLALWVAAGVVNVIAELERVRFFFMVVFARAVLWWMRWRARSGSTPSRAMLAVVRKIETALAKEDHGMHDLLAQLREAVQVRSESTTPRSAQ
ncbi:hypothetical protein [Paraburkholderia sp.]|uniref:hypothetical protein n=1 Tax=Paraburkholderia sp. TaxID=1926495 RepID=UPI003D6EC379